MSSANSNDPLTKFTMEISKKLSRFLTKDLVDQLDDDEDIYSDGQDVESVVKYHDELYYTKKFPLDIEYTSPTEPDENLVKLWLRGIHLGNQLKDISGFAHHATINGEPVLVSGNPFDLGIHTGTLKSIALRLNRPGSPYTNEESLIIPDTTDLQINGITTGISYFIRFRLSSIAEQNSFSRTLFEKIDDNTPNNGIRVLVSDTGRLIVRINRAGTQYNSQTPTSTIAVDTVYEVFITYAVSGNVTHVYVNNVDQTLTDPGASTNWHSPLTDHSMTIFGRGGTSTSGFVYGDFYDLTIWRESVLSATQVSRHYTNKWTTANIPFGQVLVPNYTASYSVAVTGSFTSASYDTDSFTF